MIDDQTIGDSRQSFSQIWMEGEIVSLWDIMRAEFFVDAVVDCIDSMEAIEKFLRGPSSVSLDCETPVLGMLDNVAKVFEDFDLGNLEPEIRLIRTLISANVPESETRERNERVAEEILVLHRIIKHRLRSQVAVVIDQRSAILLKERALSNETRAMFPTIALHYVEASQCYALGFHTASMFHCMRAGGELLPVLAPKVFESKPVTLSRNVDLHENWGLVIEHVKGRVKELDTRIGKSDPDTEKKLRGLGVVLDRMYAIKTAWRDRVMHKLDSVSQSDARDSLSSMQALIEHLAKMTW